MSKQEILEQLAKAVLEGDKNSARENAQAAVDEGLDPLEAVDRGLSKGMEVVGANFESGESFLPELLMAADSFNAAMEILNPLIEANKQKISKLGTALLATVKGDLHNIGKNIVATVLETNGFEVVDIGIDQSTLNIIEAAQKHNADFIGLSSVMTTTMPYQKEVIETLSEMGLREKFFVLVGGGPVTQKWADEIGADGYGETAVDAVGVAKKLLEKKG
ncbi:MAG: corrinoid protein [Desulfobacterales bacterium]|nr:corrinoid protein [Desulfobacterales bacterium]